MIYLFSWAHVPQRRVQWENWGDRIVTCDDINPWRGGHEVNNFHQRRIPLSSKKTIRATVIDVSLFHNRTLYWLTYERVVDDALWIIQSPVRYLFLKFALSCLFFLSFSKTWEDESWLHNKSEKIDKDLFYTLKKQS